MLFRRRFDVNVVTTSNQRDGVALASIRRGEMTNGIDQIRRETVTRYVPYWPISGTLCLDEWTHFLGQQHCYFQFYILSQGCRFIPYRVDPMLEGHVLQ